mgnify:CR=1 FL=1
MNEVMFVTGGELLQFLPISSKKRVGMSICFFGHLKEEKYKWGQVGSVSYTHLTLPTKA